MQFNTEASGFDIVTRTRYFTKVASTTDHSLAEITFSVNIWLDKVFSWILQADKRWSFEDNNQSDLPIGTIALVADQRDYGLSGATVLNILKVACKDSNGNYRILKPLGIDDPEAKDIIELRGSSGTPVRYIKNANSIILDPAPSYASTTGLRVFFQRNTVPFTTADTTAVPGFAKPFHDILPMGAAYDYLAKEGDPRANNLFVMIEKMKADLMEFYTARAEDSRPRLRLRHESYGEEGLADDFGGDMQGVRFNN
ncbi:MAG: hypothetical protein NUV80_00975 [Candidatus Berkelbacteria bacterium]|nr:hypothetical protein [Candidatus Berkelbacteria bacterium]